MRAAQLCKYTKNHWIIQLKTDTIYVCKLYLNKLLKKKKKRPCSGMEISDFVVFSSVLVSSGCLTKMPPSEWLWQQTFIFSVLQVSRLRPRYWYVWFLLWPFSWLADGWLLLVSLYTAPPLWAHISGISLRVHIPSSYKDESQIGLGPHPYGLIWT